MPMWESLGNCLEYIKGTITGARTITVALPKQSPNCAWCIYFRDLKLGQFQCQLDENYILCNPRADRREDCPVKWKE